MAAWRRALIAVVCALVMAGSLAAAVRPRAESTVIAYPLPGSRTASPDTTITLRDIAPDRIGTVTVIGSDSGRHATAVRPDSDGNGASLVLDAPLDPGEHVTVATDLSIRGADGGYAFTVSRPVTDQVAARTKPTNPSALQHFDSAPDLDPPVLTATGTMPAGDGALFLAPYQGRGGYGPMIVDPSGNLVWFHPVPDGQAAFDFRVQQLNGAPVLTWWQGVVTHGHGIGEGIIYDDHYRPVATVSAGNGYHSDLHDFNFTSRGTALITIYQPVEWDLTPVGGPKNGVVYDGIAQEIDIATGNVLMEWHSLDHVPLTDSYAGTPGSGPYDYFHINALDLADDGQLLISSRATHTVFDVAADTGEILWRLGGKEPTLAAPGIDFSSQHDARWAGAGRISLFDNAAGVGAATSTSSSGLVIAVDPTRGIASLVRRFGDADSPLAASQGDLQILPGGGAVVGWGQEPYISQFDASGRLVWQVQLPRDYQSYRAYRMPWSAIGAGAPAVAVMGAGAAQQLAVSWNGATGVTAWRIVPAGEAGAGAAADVGTAGDAGAGAAGDASFPAVVATGFETHLPLPAGIDGPVVVQALDWTGTVLGASAPVDLTAGGSGSGA